MLKGTPGGHAGLGAGSAEPASMPMKIFHPAAIVGAIVYWLWGALWYTIFGSQWLSLTNAARNPTAPAPYVVSILMALVMSYGTAIALGHDDDRTALNGVQFGVFIGFMFLASTMLTAYVYEGRPLQLWVINGAYEIIGFAIVGAIIGGWKRKAPTPK